MPQQVGDRTSDPFGATRRDTHRAGRRTAGPGKADVGTGRAGCAAARGSVSIVDGAGGEVGVRVGDPSWRGERAAHALSMESCAEPDNASGKNAGITECFQCFPDGAGPKRTALGGGGEGWHCALSLLGRGRWGAQGLELAWNFAEVQSKAPAHISDSSTGAEGAAKRSSPWHGHCPQQ